MFKQSKRNILAAAVLLPALLAGCAGAQSTPEPTVDTQPTFAFVQTQAVHTAVAEMTLNAPTATQVPPTETPAPTATETPTQAPTPIPPTPTATFRPWTPTPSATPVAYACTITEQSPANSTDYKPGADFDARWVVKNTGAETWRADSVDIAYVSGTGKFHKGNDRLDLKQDVAPQGAYTIVLDMLAPSTAGTYSTSWALSNGSQTVCTLTLTIDVVP